MTPPETDASPIQELSGDEAPPSTETPVEETAPSETAVEDTPVSRSVEAIIAAAQSEPRHERFARVVEYTAETTLRQRLQAAGGDLRSFRCGTRTCVGEIDNTPQTASVARNWMMQACVEQCQFGLSGLEGDPVATIFVQFAEADSEPVFDEVLDEQASSLERITSRR